MNYIDDNGIRETPIMKNEDKKSSKRSQRPNKAQSTNTDQRMLSPQEIKNIITQINDDIKTADDEIDERDRMVSKGAKRQRVYREKHRDEINRRSRDSRRRQRLQKKKVTSDAQKTDGEQKKKQSTQATSNNSSSNSHSLKKQRFYKRRKEINRQKRNSTLNKKNQRTNESERNGKEINKRRRGSRLIQTLHRAHTEYNE